MNSAALITDLRKAGVQLYREGTRLIVEAPPGIVTPEIRAELLRAKHELLTAVDRRSSEAMGDDQIAAEALRYIADLLALAYRRSAAHGHTSAHREAAHIPRGLALPGEASVHGVGT